MADERSYRARGIVLRRTKLGETDLIVTLLADQPAQVRAVAKGARKPGAKLAGVVGLGNDVELQLHRGRSLDIVTEGTLLASREAASRELERSVMMEAVLDTCCDLTAEGEHDARLLPLTTTALDAVLACRTGLLALVGAAYVLKAVSMQGYRPILGSCVSCGRAVALEGEGVARLSFEDGGTLCDECSLGLRGSMLPRATLAWARSLIGMTFAQISALEPHDGEGRLGFDVLEFAREWLHHYPGIRPRALDFVFSLQQWLPQELA